MRKILLVTFLASGSLVSAQTAIQSVNSGALITASSSVSIGEIVVVPANPDQTSSGLIGILAQSSPTLEVPELDLAQNVRVYPNPTASQIHFTDENLSGKIVHIFNASGQEVLKQAVTANTIDLESLSQGVYLIQFENTRGDAELSNAKNIKTFKIVKH